MLRKLGKSITIVNAAAFTVVILIGGISIYLTQQILRSAYKTKGISEDIIAIDSIHADTYHLIRNLHHFLLEEDDFSSQEAMTLINKLRSTIEEYKAHELHEETGKEKDEVNQLDIMLDDIRNLEKVKTLVEEFKAKGTYDSDTLIGLEQHAYEIEETSNLINRIHMIKINKLVDDSLTKMWQIFLIYLLFASIGGISIYAGHRLLLKNVVLPIRELSSATIEFAGGTYDKRVYTDSVSEIGLLYQSFNKMAERLQENDEFLRKFNEELEKKVIERTQELQQTNEELKKTQDALIRTERIAAVGQIAAGVTHEIKNPLNSLSINTQMLIKEFSEKFGKDSSAFESASLIKHEINRINNILEEFVKFAKFPEPRFFDNDINQVIREVADLISESAREENVKVTLSLCETMPVIKFDARQFKEVIINLSQNAIRSMPDGGKLEIRTALADKNIIIDIIDTGEGIREANLEKIFKPFYSTREKGLGLGLPIVQRIIESHGGTISCNSEPGTGTIFKIILPVERG